MIFNIVGIFRTEEKTPWEGEIERTTSKIDSLSFQNLDDACREAACISY